MQLTIKQACNSGATPMQNQPQQPLDVEALLAFAKSVGTTSKQQVDDFYRQMGQPHQKTLLQEFVHSSSPHPHTKAVVLILAKAYQIDSWASINILYERARIMLNWHIDIEAKEVLREGFRQVISLNEDHKKRVDLLLREMGQIVFQIASDPAREVLYESMIDLEEASPLSVRHPQDFSSLASAYLKLLFWRFHATGFIIEPQEMDTICCRDPFTALVKLVVGKYGLSRCPSVIEQLIQTCQCAFQIGLCEKVDMEYTTFLRHIFCTWPLMSSSFELIYQAGCSPLPSGAFNYLQTQYGLELKEKAASFHLSMLEKRQKIQTSLPLSEQLPALIPSILTTLASGLEELSEDWEGDTKFLKLLLELLEVNITEHLQGPEESMDCIRLTVLPLVGWGIRLSEEQMEDGQHFSSLLDQFCLIDTPSLKKSAASLLSTILEYSPDTTPILFDLIASSLEDFFNDNQPALSLKEVAIILTMIYNQRTHEGLITNILRRHLEKGSSLLARIGTEELHYFYYLLESIVHLFDEPLLSPFIEHAITMAPKQPTLQFNCLKFLQAVFEKASDCQPYLELILSHLAFCRAPDAVSAKWELISHISGFLKGLKDNQLDLLVEFLREGVYRQVQKLEEQASRGCKLYLKQFKQYINMCERVISYRNHSFHPDLLCKIITMVAEILPAAAKLKIFPTVTKLLQPLFKNTHQNSQVISLIQPLIEILLKLLQERTFLSSHLLAPVFQYLTMFENLQSQETLASIYVAFSNSLLYLASRPRTDQSFILSLRNLLLLQYSYLDRLGENLDPSIIKDLSMTNHQLKEIVEAHHPNSLHQRNLLGQFKLVQLLISSLQGQEINYLTLLLPISQLQFSAYSSFQLLCFMQKKPPASVPSLTYFVECCFCLLTNERKQDKENKINLKTFEDVLVSTNHHFSANVPMMVSQLFIQISHSRRDLYQLILNSSDPNKANYLTLCLQNPQNKNEREKMRKTLIEKYYSPQMVWKKIMEETRTIRKVLGDKQDHIDLPLAETAKRDHSVETIQKIGSKQDEPDQLFKVRIDNCLNHERMVAEQPSDPTASAFK